MTRREEIAWAAGLFEGEGCIARLAYRSGRVSVALVMSMADRDVMERFVRVVGRGGLQLKYRGDKPAHHKNLWEWRISARGDVEAVMEILWDWLGERRQERYNDIMDNVTPVVGSAELQRQKTHCVNGHPYSPENVYSYRGYRQCRACRREGRRRRSAA